VAGWRLGLETGRVEAQRQHRRYAHWCNPIDSGNCVSSSLSMLCRFSVTFTVATRAGSSTALFSRRGQNQAMKRASL
jgi:hypothetical protein